MKNTVGLIFTAPVLTLLITVFISLSARSEILFEGYYKVMQFKKHIGFYVLRNELDAKTGNFKTYSFTRLAKKWF